MNQKNFYLFIFLLTGIVSCKKDIKYDKTPSGLEYYYLEKSEQGRGGEPGDFYLVDMIGQREDDSVFINSYTMGQKIKFVRTKPPFHSMFNDALGMLKSGDSIIFRMSADSFFIPLGQPLPNYLHKNELIRFTLTVKDVLNPEAHLVKMYEYELVKMLEFLDQKKWKYATDSTGIKYEIIKEGNTIKAKVGDEVEVSYLLKYLNGKIINRTKPGDPLKFTVGSTDFINGLSRLALMAGEGAKLQAVIPFSEGFGEEGNAYISPYATLLLEMDIIKVIKKTSQGF